MRLQSPKGFKDYLPKEALKRKLVLDKIKTVFEKFGFDPLETPTLEYEETLTGKYGEEEKLIYKFETPGGDKVALKYDQTVPLVRVVAQYGPKGEQKLPIPFKRYQIQSAYRGENTQKGRYREFLQCDVDVVGISSPLLDAELLAIAFEVYKSLGLEIIIKINDRMLLQDIEPKYLSALDKLLKIGEGGVLQELQDKGMDQTEASELLNRVKNLKPSGDLQKTTDLYFKMGYPKDSLEFEPTIVRGLDYYTGIILEVVLKSNPTASSLAAGGKYDKLIGKFTGLDIPANGFSIGLERTIEAMDEIGVLDVAATSTKVLVTIFDPELTESSLEITSRLRSNNIATEIWLDPNTKLDKQLKYADQKGIPYAVIIGPDEAGADKAVLKNLSNKTQQTLSLDGVIQKLSS